MRTRAIILKKQATNEHDQLVTCYTEEFGKLTAIAKSVLKPHSIQAMHLDLVNLVDFELLNGRAMPIITGAQAEEIYPALKNDLPAIAAAYFFSEAVDCLFFEQQKDEETWNFLTSLLKELNLSASRGKNIDGILKAWQVEFLNILGYYPNLNECSFCTSPIDGRVAVYSVSTKGAVCQDCFLGGCGGIVIRNGELFTRPVLSAIFESLAERKLNSLSLINTVIK